MTVLPRLKRKVDLGRGGAAVKPAASLPAAISSQGIPIRSRKRSITDDLGECMALAMGQVPYARYGITSRKLINKRGNDLTCIILCRSWPSWFWAARSRNYQVKMVIVSNPIWKSVLLNTSPSTEVLVWSAGSICWDFPAVTAVFSHFDLKGSLQVLWEQVSDLVILEKAEKNIPSGWNYNKHTMKHVLVGGVTDGQWIMHVYTSSLTGNLKPVLQAQRDATTILDSMITPGHPCKPPITPEGNIPEILSIRPTVFHAAGLLPWRGQAPKVVTKNVFSPTKWCCRPITSAERLYSRDITASLLQSLPTNLQRALIQEESYLPDKCCMSLLDGCGSLTSCEELQSSSDGKPLKQDLTLGTGSAENILRRETELEAKRIQAATKADDADIPVHLWDQRILPDTEQAVRGPVLDKIRSFCLRWWRRQVLRGFLTWFKSSYPSTVINGQLNIKQILRTASARRDLECGRDCIWRCSGASWWEWDVGSRPFHWRWPKEYQELIRDGLKPWFKAKPADVTVPQRGEVDPVIRNQVTQKLTKVLSKGYLGVGHVRALTSFFTVPKGDKDVRIVYNGTKSGLNDCLWAPWFCLPTVEQHLRAVEPGTYLADVDIGEQFHNFIMHQPLQPYAGVDLTPFFPDSFGVRATGKRTKRTFWVRWTRCGMGFKISPYNAGQAMLFAEELIRGDPADTTNLFHFDQVVLNIPGQENYQPSLPWLYKFRSADQRLACDFFVYVDDVRSTGSTYEECWAATRAVASKYNYLGLQDAARKRRAPSVTAGPWAGSTVHTHNNQVTVTTTLERWEKAKAMIAWIYNCTVIENKPLVHKTLESYRGSLVYLSRTYPSLVPYLKGIHLTLDSWRPNRDEEGWKLPSSCLTPSLDQDLKRCNPVEPPTTVLPVPQLSSEIHALKHLFEPAIPPLRLVTPTSTATAAYGFGDASGSGFGTTLLIKDTLHYQHGQWTTAHQEESSNYRKLSNLIFGIEEAVEHKLLADCELFLFTDNSTAEAAFHKGTSTRKRLFDLILRLRSLQMHSGLHLHVIHVAGTRMQWQGTDDLSRGQLSTGALGGQDMLSYVPLHLSAIAREPALLPWVQSWLGVESVYWTTPFSWYSKLPSAAVTIWCPPPGVVDAALEQLASATHKRPNTAHVVLIPRLMLSRWRRLLGKICDLVFFVPVGTSCWANSQFEPLIVGFCLPLLPFSPWQFRGTAFVDNVAQLLSSLPRTHNDWGGGYSAPILVPDAVHGHHVRGHGTVGVIGRQIMGSSRWLVLRMRMVKS